jgi:phosphohistidine phosphatase
MRRLILMRHAKSDWDASFGSDHDRPLESGEWATTVEVTGDLYGTSPNGALQVASKAPPKVDSLMLVGHEPTWSALAYHLTGGAVTVKTATVVGIDLQVDHWHRLPTVSGYLAFVLQPRHFTKKAWEIPTA